MVTFWTPGASPKDPLNPCLPVGKPGPPSLPVFLRNRPSLKKKMHNSTYPKLEETGKNRFSRNITIWLKIEFFSFFWKILFLVFPWYYLKWKVRLYFFLIGIQAMQGWTATTRHGLTRKEAQKRLLDIQNLFRNNLQLKDLC